MTSPNLSNIYCELNDAIPRELPKIPQEMIDYRALSTMKQIELKDNFFRAPVIQEYLEAKWKVELYNRDTFLRLHELLTDNAQNAEIVGPLKIKLEQFKRKINQNPKPFEALRLDWSKYPL